MGKMKTWWIFGYERWGGLRPARMGFPDGRQFVPLFLGLWLQIRGRESHVSKNNRVVNAFFYDLKSAQQPLAPGQGGDSSPEGGSDPEVLSTPE